MIDAVDIGVVGDAGSIGSEMAVTVAPLDDDELTAFALASDPGVELDADAQCFWDVTGSGTDPWLPEWYMPSPMRGGPLLHGWRRRVVFLVIASFLAITAYGLCNTYGQLAFG